MTRKTVYAGDFVYAEDMQEALNTGATAGDQTLTAGTTTSTSWATALTGAGSVSSTLVVPPSGVIIVSWAGLISNSGANTSYLGFSISGASTLAGDDECSVRNVGTTALVFGMTCLVPRGGGTALTPGSSITVALTHRVSAGTGTFDNRWLTICGG